MLRFTLGIKRLSRNNFFPLKGPRKWVLLLLFENRRGEMLWHLQAPPHTCYLFCNKEQTTYFSWILVQLQGSSRPDVLAEKTLKHASSGGKQGRHTVCGVGTCDSHSLCCGPPSPCCWDINQSLLLCKDFRMFWSMSMLGKWEVCPFVKIALRDIFTNYIQGPFRRKLKLELSWFVWSYLTA